MLIQNIVLKNFRCFKDVAIDFESLSIIVGENGTGKTAILEAINYAFSSSFLSSRIEEQDFNCSDENVIEIQVHLTESFIVQVPDGYQSRSIPCDKIVLRIKRREKSAPNKAFSDPYVITHFALPDDSVYKDGENWILQRNSGTELKISQRHLTFPINSENFPRIFYYNKERDNHAETGFNTSLNKIITEYNWRFRKKLEGFGEDYHNNWQTFYDQIISSIDDKKYDETFNAVKRKLSAMTGKDFENLELSILNLKAPFTKSFFSQRDKLHQINFRNFGSGISMILSFCFLDTISRLSKEKAIFLIDEPEMHLHPQLQKKLFEFIDQSESQIVYTTHAESMVPLNKWKSIRRVNSSFQCYPNLTTLEERITYRSKTDSVINHLLDIPKYYQDKTIYTRENNSLFFARLCVLVEGPADKYAIETCATFDLTDLTIISCNGKDKIFYYQLLCKAYSVPYFTLFDLGSESIEIEPNLTIKECSLSDYYFAFDTSLEDLLGVTGDKHKASRAMERIDSLREVPSQIVNAIQSISSFIEKLKISSVGAKNGSEKESRKEKARTPKKGKN